MQSDNNNHSHEADRRRVLLIARGGAVDGAARQLLYLVTHLDRARFVPTVMADSPGAIVDALRAVGAAVEITGMRPWRSLRGLPFRSFDARAATNRARSLGTVLVHCSDPWKAPYARHAARSLGVPLVLHVRGPTTPRDLRKYRCLDADRIIGIAERYRAEIESAGYPARKITIIDDAVDTAEYRADPELRQITRAALGIENHLAVGIVGRIEPLKRTMEFIEAAAHVPPDVPAKFLVIGAANKPEYADQVRRRIGELNLGDRVQLLGRRDDMPAVLGALDLLVTLSGGSVMFEGMACNTCLLSVRPDGRHSQHTIHDETAWCVTTDHPEPAGQAMTLLLRDHALRERLAEAGRACVTERLCPRRMTRLTEAVYDQLHKTNQRGTHAQSGGR